MILAQPAQAIFAQMTSAGCNNHSRKGFFISV